MLRASAHICALLALVCTVALPALPVAGQGAEEEWGPILTDQMMMEYDCEVAFFSQVAERSVDGDLVVIAKVHCQDKRTFDAYRASRFEIFEIHPCENPNNRVC